MSRREYLLVSLLLVAIPLAIGLAVGAAAMGYYLGERQGQVQAEAVAEEQYYRGMYDVCLGQISQPDRCRQATARFRASGEWYELPSPGFEWPLQVEPEYHIQPAPERNLDDQRTG
jgi:hypothetical protein